MVGVIALGSVVALPSANAEHNRFGVSIDAGVPDGVGGALSFRPHSRIRLHSGVAHNLLGIGLRGGVSGRMLETKVSPSVTLEGGHFFKSDPGFLTSVVDDEDGVLDSISYTYMSALGGFEYNNGDMAVYLQVGVSKLFTNLYFVEQEQPMVEIKSRSDLNFVTLSGRLGWVYMF